MCIRPKFEAVACRAATTDDLLTAATQLIMSSGGPSVPMQITVGERTYTVVDRNVQGVRLLPGPRGRLARTMRPSEKREDFEKRMQALFDEAQAVCAHAHQTVAPA